MKIVQMRIPASNKFTRLGIAMGPKWITIHETGTQAKVRMRLFMRNYNRLETVDKQAGILR